jgi:Mn-dependent DtxR family transcriptional regulator
MKETNSNVALSDRAFVKIDVFLDTLRDNYVYPNSVTSNKIEAGLGLSGSEIRDIVRVLRRQGVLVVSDSKGYSYTDDERVMREVCLPHLKARRNSIDITIREVESAMWEHKQKKERVDSNQYELLK